MISFDLNIIFHGIACSFAYGSLGLICLKCYRSHTHLFYFHFSREYMDDWIDILAPFTKVLIPSRIDQYLLKTLPIAGFHHSWTPKRIFTLILLISFLFFSLAIISSIVIPFISFWIAPTTGLIIILLSFLYIHEKAKNRSLSCRRDLSFFLDYISLAMASGMEFTTAIKEVIKSAPPSVLRDEFTIMSIDLEFGKSRMEVLIDFQNRVAAKEVRVVVQNLIQSLKLGSNIQSTITSIADSLNSSRFTKAEETAGKISVKMMIPLLVFVMPVVLILIIGPVMISIMNT